MSWLANQHARQRTTQSYAQCVAQKLKMKSLKISAFVNIFAWCFFDRFSLMILFLLVCQRHWLVQRHGRLVSTWKGNMQFAFQTSRGLICTLISRAQSLEMAFSTKDDEFQLEHMKLVRMLSNVMSIGSFFWLAHVSSPMPVFRHPKNLAASSSRATIHGICLVMHTSRLLTTWVPWLGYARSL